jgi:hypothetical protein
MPAPKLNRPLAIAILTFGLLCLFYSAWPVWRAFFPLEIDRNEPWNAYWADAAMGGTLYPDPDFSRVMIANNYPPLSFYTIGFLGQYLCVVIGLCIRTLQGSMMAAVLGGLWFLGSAVRWTDWYVGMNDPNLLGLAIMALALLWFLRRDPVRGAEPPILLAVVAGFFKHSLIATPAAMLILLARHHMRLALRAALFGIAAAAIGLALCTLVYGTNFIEQVFFYPREISLMRMIGSLERIVWLLPTVGIWWIWSWHERRSEPAQVSAILMVCAFASYLLQKNGEATDANMMFELMMASAIGIGVAFDRISAVPFAARIGAQRAQFGIVAIMTATLLAAPGLEPYWLVASPDYRAQFARNAEVARSEALRVSAISGKVACIRSLMVCRSAGKEFVFDQVAVGQRIGTGRMTSLDMWGLFEANGIRYEVIDQRATVLPLQRQLFYGRMSEVE